MCRRSTALATPMQCVARFRVNTKLNIITLQVLVTLDWAICRSANKIHLSSLLFDLLNKVEADYGSSLLYLWTNHQTCPVT